MQKKKQKREVPLYPLPDMYSTTTFKYISIHDTHLNVITAVSYLRPGFLLGFVHTVVYNKNNRISVICVSKNKSMQCDVNRYFTTTSQRLFRLTHPTVLNTLCFEVCTIAITVTDGSLTFRM